MAETVTVNGVTYTKWVSEGMGWQREDGGWMADEERPAMLNRIAELELSYDADHKVNMANIADFKADNDRLREALRECAENGITRAVREALQGDKDGR